MIDNVQLVATPQASHPHLNPRASPASVLYTADVAIPTAPCPMKHTLGMNRWQ